MPHHNEGKEEIGKEITLEEKEEMLKYLINYKDHLILNPAHSDKKLVNSQKQEEIDIGNNVRAKMFKSKTFGESILTAVKQSQNDLSQGQTPSPILPSLGQSLSDIPAGRTTIDIKNLLSRYITRRVRLSTTKILVGENPHNVSDYEVSSAEKALRKALLCHQSKINVDIKDHEETSKENEVDSEENKETNKEEKAETILKKEDEKCVDNNMEMNNMEEKQSEFSQTSGGKRLSRKVFSSLRAAIDEPYVPKSLLNLAYGANVMFLILLGFGSNIVNFIICIVVIFAVLFTQFQSVSSNISNIQIAENRIVSLLYTDSIINNMMIITTDYNYRQANPQINSSNYLLNVSTSALLSTFENYCGQLQIAAKSLEIAQTQLVISTQNWNSAVDSDNLISLKYFQVPGLFLSNSYTIWQAIMEITASSYRISEMSITQVDDTSDSTVYFVTQNALNNVLLVLQNSTNTIMSAIQVEINSNDSTLLYLFCTVSVLLFISTIALIPIVQMIKKGKEEVLVLFMKIKKKSISSELDTCRKFAGTFHYEENMQMVANENNEEDFPLATTGRLLNKDQHTQSGQSSRQFTKLNLNIGLLVFKLMIFILIIESYFVMIYFLSSTFWNGALSMAQEYQALLQRFPTDILVLLAEKYYLIRN